MRRRGVGIGGKEGVVWQRRGGGMDGEEKVVWAEKRAWYNRRRGVVQFRPVVSLLVQF